MVPNKRSRLLKPFPRHFARKQTSFINSWSAIVNPDLLESCYIRVQLPRVKETRSEHALSISNKFHQSDFKIPDSNIHFVRGTPINNDIKSPANQQDSDNESVVSVSSEEIDCEGGVETEV